MRVQRKLDRSQSVFYFVPQAGSTKENGKSQALWGGGEGVHQSGGQSKGGDRGHLTFPSDKHIAMSQKWKKSSKKRLKEITALKKVLKEYTKEIVKKAIYRVFFYSFLTWALF